MIINDMYKQSTLQMLHSVKSWSGSMLYLTLDH